jgi:hypothetical protein
MWEIFTRGNLLMELKMDMADIFIRMVTSMRGSGKMENTMVRVNI